MKEIYYDDETMMFQDGVATCTLSDKEGNVYVGIARCHPDDKDFESEKVGFQIAFYRAYIKVLYEVKKELQIQLNTLKQFYYSINQSKQYNEKSYENSMLQRSIRRTTSDLVAAKQELVTAKQNLREYIDGKDKLHKKLRATRNKDKKE